MLTTAGPGARGLSHGQILLSQLGEQRRAGRFCDVLFDHGGKTLLAHTCILAVYSPFMMRYFLNSTELLGNWSVLSPLKINLSVLTKCEGKSSFNCFECLSEVIRFIYSGKIKLELSHVSHVVNIANNLEISDLVHICCKFENNAAPCKLVDGSVKPAKSDANDTDRAEVDGPCVGESNRIVCLPEEKPNMVEGEPEIKTSLNQESSVEESHNFCDSCHITFKSCDQLKQHKLVLHSRKYVCLNCEFSSFKLICAVKHLLDRCFVGSTCSICLYTSDNSASLREHILDHKREKPFSCPSCPTRFKTRIDWRRHLSTHNEQSHLNCPECKLTFKKVSSFNNHVLTHSKKSKHLCEVCGFTTRYPSYLQRHKLKHSEKNFQCSILDCSFATAREGNLKQHLETVHNAIKPFKCKLCNVLFSYDKNLRRHLQVVHSSAKEKYSCYLCDFTAVRLDKLKGHCLSKHSKDKDKIKVKEMLDEYKKLSKLIDHSSFIPKYKKVEDDWKNKIPEKTIQDDSLSMDSSNSVMQPSNVSEPDTHDVASHDLEQGLHSANVGNSRPTVFLSETTGEITIISEKEGGAIPVASVTSTNLLTIGNFREGTGSVTLNEVTGILTFNNINSESTGAVFLNESTGELSYINLNKDKEDTFNSFEPPAKKPVTTLNEFTGEICTQTNNDSLDDFCLDDDFLFDSPDFDFINDDSLDGDDFDNMLFEMLPPPLDSSPTTDAHSVPSEKNIPRLNEATGELSFDCLEQEGLPESTWHQVCQLSQGPDPQHEAHFNETFLNEVTGEFIFNDF